MMTINLKRRLELEIRNKQLDPRIVLPLLITMSTVSKLKHP